MKSILTFLACVFLATGCGDNSGEISKPIDKSDVSEILRRRHPDQQIAVEGNTAFALDLYGKLRQRPGNLVLSPSSISLALGMIYAGARGETERQMASVLHFELSQERVHPALAALAQALRSVGPAEPQLAIANRLWAREGFSLREAFLNVTRDHYGAELGRTVFPEPGRTEINAWTADHTANKIQQLIKEGVLDEQTVLVLVSAIYFKGQWVDQFSEAKTKPADFYVMPEQVVQVPMMHTQDGSFSYGEDEEVQILELPYRAGEAGGKCSMVILLPKEKDGLPRLEASLTPEKLRHLLSELVPKDKFPVYLPKFTFSSEFSLLQTLRELGLTNVHDFRGMSDGGSLFLSAVEHGGFIRVDETGTEAAAATAGIMKTSSGSPWPVFRADHPFLFAITHKATRSILFLGRLVRP
jgi:serpin B